jgi:hypothetical protein
MKKILFPLLILIAISCNRDRIVKEDRALGQARLPYSTMTLISGGDSLQISIGDTVEFLSNSPFVNFNSTLLVDGDTVSGSGSVGYQENLSFDTLTSSEGAYITDAGAGTLIFKYVTTSLQWIPNLSSYSGWGSNNIGALRFANFNSDYLASFRNDTTIVDGDATKDTAIAWSAKAIKDYVSAHAGGTGTGSGTVTSSTHSAGQIPYFTGTDEIGGWGYYDPGDSVSVTSSGANARVGLVTDNANHNSTHYAYLRADGNGTYGSAYVAAASANNTSHVYLNGSNIIGTNTTNAFAFYEDSARITRPLKLSDSLFLEGYSPVTRYSYLYLDTLAGNAVKADSTVLSASYGLTTKVKLDTLLKNTVNGEILWQYAPGLWTNRPDTLSPGQKDNVFLASLELLANHVNDLEQNTDPNKVQGFATLIYLVLIVNGILALFIFISELRRK